MKQVCLLTGRPGTGKTSLIRQAVAGMKGKAGGFYTEEMRSGGIRRGFRLVTLDGQEIVLAHVGIHSRYRVSKYGVDVEALDRVGVPAIRKAAEERDLVVIDEIGKMELFSPGFREVVLQVIDSGKMVLGTIMLNPNPWADAIKRRPQVNLLTVSRDNRREVLGELSGWLETAQVNF
jgi:nucleoside-triphosphatase